VIVNDGSTDSTPAIIDRYTAAHEWIDRLDMPAHRDRSFAAKAHCFNAATERVSGLQYEVIGNVDADVAFEPDYLRFVPDAKVFYRQHGFDRLSSIDRSDKKLESQFLSMKLHVAYLRSLEESERVRAASLTYLQTWFGCFFEGRPDLARELERLAATLDGRLEAPRLSWKCLWIQKLFGWSAAKEVHQHWNRCKSSTTRSWDKVLFELERSSGR
jgi:hypothetical protein